MSAPRLPSARVISIGKNSNVLSLRHAILELAGYEVWSTTNFSFALSFIRHERCGVLLLSYSIPEGWRKTFIGTFRKLCPDGRVIAILKRENATVPEDVDEIIFDTDPAEVLLNAVSNDGKQKAAA